MIKKYYLKIIVWLLNIQIVCFDDNKRYKYAIRKGRLFYKYRLLSTNCELNTWVSYKWLSSRNLLNPDYNGEYSTYFSTLQKVGQTFDYHYTVDNVRTVYLERYKDEQ